jgi:hypothetical protein
VKWLAGQIRDASSGGIFPVAGYIVEPASSGGRSWQCGDLLFVP